ncbi:MFS general substrate transporter [Hortaea werneckii]|uniref:Cercosporin MFS transporter CTB4 n=1 Tax=Hortaea werneckii TaxID=91943 RepID=A0A3M7DDY6_HORWE|nr:MFS general substrate transporter [Hortaea werneckii]KAI7720893.1 MFS general substrate transporter [Hortaea werneckii]RMY62541.1 hypothetical protein D0865_00368 [Hortaea werneckii]
MNEEDRRLSASERDAEPDRFPSAADSIRKTWATTEGQESKEHLSRTPTAASSSTESSVRRQEIGISRIVTEHEQPFDLERHPTALSRIQTGRSQHSQTIGTGLRSRTVSRQSKKPLPNFGGGKPFPPPLPNREEYVVEFDGPEDPLHAMNWSLGKKLRTSVILSFVSLIASFGSSIFSAALSSVAAHFGFGSEVGILGVSLYVLGFATGPLLWAPWSELYGRKQPLVISSFLFSIFHIAVAVAKDAQTVFIGRFFGGFFGAAPLTVVGAVFADMYNNRQRGLAITAFAMTVFCGPLLSPFVGGFIDMSYLGWRWTEYLTAILGFAGLVLTMFFFDESYPPIILVNKAADLRRRTKNWGIHAKQEEIEVDWEELIQKNLSRPMRMLFTEPIVLLLSIYMSFVYGLLYLFLTFYEIVFQEVHGMNKGVGGLPYFGMIIGEMIAGIFMIASQPSYNRKLAANNNVPKPEWRMPPAILGGALFSVGIFWFAWAGYRPDIHWMAPTSSGLFTGFGIMVIFLQCMNYLIDAYLVFAASAIAANTFLRSLCGAGFPLFATYMIKGMGIQWAGTLLGCVAAVLVPIPAVFWWKGAKIRERSSFAPSYPAVTKAHDSPQESDEEKAE